VIILEKQKDAQEFEVVDLSHGLAKDDPSIIALSDSFDFIDPFAAGQGGYVPPAPVEEQQVLLANEAYPQTPIMIAGDGPTAPPPEAFAGPTAPVMTTSDAAVVAPGYATGQPNGTYSDAVVGEPPADAASGLPPPNIL